MRCGRRWSGADFNGQFLVALPAVHKMTPHRRARCRGRTAANGVNDFQMFILNALKISPLIFNATLADALSRYDEASKIFQKTFELSVAGGIRDTAMK